MPLERYTISVPLSQGLDTKTDPKQLKLGKLTAMSNLVFTETGDLSPRFGGTGLAQSILGGGSISTGLTAAALNDSLLELDGTQIYSYSESQLNWAAKGMKQALSLSVFPVTGSAQNLSVQDSALHSSGVGLFSWIDSVNSTASYAMLDTTTKATIVAQAGSLTATNCKPLVISSNSSFTLLLQNAGNIQYATAALATPSSPSGATNLITITSGSAPFDACTGPTYAYVFYVSGANVVSISRVDSTHTVINTVALSGSATCLSCWYDTTNSYVWLVWYDGTNVKYAVYDSALASVRAATTVAAESSVSRVTGATVGTTATVYYEVAGTAAADSYVKMYTATSGGVATSVSQVRSVGLAGKAYAYNSQSYALAVHDSSLQSTYFLIKPLGFSSYAQGTVVGKLAPLSAGGTPTIKTLPSIYATTAGKYLFPYLLKSNATTLSGVVTSTLAFQAAVFDHTNLPKKQALANNQHFSGAMLTGYDGASATEHGFNLFPEGGAQYTPIVTGGLIPGTYSYKFSYEWIDNFGQTQRSAPSTGLQAIVAAVVGRASNGVDTTHIDIQIEADATNPTRFIYPGATVSDTLATFTAGTTIASISDANTVQISVADVGGTFSVPATFGTKNSFTWGGQGRTVTVTKPTTLYTFGATTSGSAQLFVNVRSGLVAGQAISDSTGAISGGTTVSSFIYKNGGALITMSANAAATRDKSIIKIVHGTGWPLASWLHKGQVIAGSGITADTTIQSVDDTNAQITVDLPVTGATSGTFTVTGYYQSQITIPTLRLTEKGRTTPPVQIAVWRTENNGTQYYKVGYGLNDTTADSIVFYDDTSDDDLVGNTPLYTNGGEVENIAAPASDFLTSFKNRVILLPSEDGYSWWYSKQVIAGTPVEFSDLFVQAIDQRGGPLTCAAPMDDKLILFKQSDNVFYVVGDGPSPAGTNNDFSYPQLIAGAPGCNESKSLVVTPIGLIYKSPKGFYLLDRGLNPTYIGSDVEDYNSYTVTSAVLLSGTTQARFTLSGGGVLMYDYFSGQWGNFSAITAVDAVLYGTTWAYLTTAGLVVKESAAYSDNGSVIATSFTTGWISFDKVQNYQRLREIMVLGQYLSAHTLSISIYQDFSTTPSQTISIPVTSDPGNYQYELPLTVQKCESVQIVVTCTPSSTGGGAKFSALSFDFGIKKGLNRLSASRSYGA